MDVRKIIDSLKNCPCGRDHSCDLKEVITGSGIVHSAGQLLAERGFPKRILVVADQNTLAASEGILQSLDAAAFNYSLKLYDDLRVADMEQVNEIEALLGDVDGVLSVGSGSLNDICRYATYTQKKELALFATAPSMDGFASGHSPLTYNNFKITYLAHQPSYILADTKILAAAPAVLKSSGFGDMIAKYIALVDWKIANLISDEYLCPRVFELTSEGLQRIVALADNITKPDEDAAESVLEALIFTGIAMHVAGVSRPGSGDEHIVSHFWECKKLQHGQISDFHGKKCGVATVLVNRIYHKMVEREQVTVQAEQLDWADIQAAYGGELAEEMMQLNAPTTITADIDPKRLQAAWPEIRRIVQEELPSDEELTDLMRRAGAATTPQEIGVTDELLHLGLKYHTFMRRRVTLMRLRPMLGFDLDPTKA